jgi:hypothetical protein
LIDRIQLNPAVYLELNRPLAAAKVLSLQHVAILELQSVGGSDSGKQQHDGRR